MHKLSGSPNPDIDHRRKGVKIANAADYDAWERRTKLFLFWFGAYGDTKVYVWADHLESALEEAMDWLANNAPGVFTTLDEGDLRAAAEDEGLEGGDVDAVVERIMGRKGKGQRSFRWSLPGSVHDYADRVLERAEADLTMVGHTTYPNLPGPLYIPSWEWNADEVTGNEREEVLRASKAVNARSYR